MARIPEHILNEIQDRCDIVEVISGYIPMKQAGRNFKALCPFHHEKTPSFIVSPDKQIYHCFGCNSGGNVFNFIKEYEKIDFIDSVKMLAQKAGVKLPEYKKDNSEESSLAGNIYAVNDIAANFYIGILQGLPSSSPVRRYLDKRGLEEHIIKKFRIGYADASRRSFLEYLLKRGIKEEIGLKAGLIVKGKDGSYHSLFRDRIVFPICDARDRILGFGARVIDDSLPKYINSPETTVYKKGRHLFGLNFAKSQIKEKGFAIISEGYLDVITCHQYNILNAISSLGTALTAEQIMLLKRYTHNVVMVYDSDEAGEMATLRGLDLFLEEGMNVKVATLDEGHDPDSFIRKFGPRGFNEAIKKAKGLFSYRLSILLERFKMDEPESKAEIVKEMLSTICRVRDSVLKAEYIKNLSQELLIKEDAIWDELKKAKKTYIRHDAPVYPGQTQDSRHDTTGNPRKSISVSPAEKILLKLMLEDIKVINTVKESLRPFDFKNPEIRCLVEELFSINKERDKIDATRLINYLEDRVTPNLISFIVNDEIEIKNKEKNILDCIKTIKKNMRDERLKDIQARLSIAKKKGYGGEMKDLLEEFNRLIKGGD